MHSPLGHRILSASCPAPATITSQEDKAVHFLPEFQSLAQINPWEAFTESFQAFLSMNTLHFCSKLDCQSKAKELSVPRCCMLPRSSGWEVVGEDGVSHLFQPKQKLGPSPEHATVSPQASSIPAHWSTFGCPKRSSWISALSFLFVSMLLSQSFTMRTPPLRSPALPCPTPTIYKRGNRTKEKRTTAQGHSLQVWWEHT